MHEMSQNQAVEQNRLIVDHRGKAIDLHVSLWPTLLSLLKSMFCNQRNNQ